MAAGVAPCYPARVEATTETPGRLEVVAPREGREASAPKAGRDAAPADEVTARRARAAPLLRLKPAVDAATATETAPEVPRVTDTLRSAPGPSPAWDAAPAEAIEATGPG